MGNHGKTWETMGNHGKPWETYGIFIQVNHPSLKMDLDGPAIHPLSIAGC